MLSSPQKTKAVEQKKQQTNLPQFGDGTVHFWNKMSPDQLICFDPACMCFGADSQVNGSPQLSPTSVTSSNQEPFKPSLLAQFLQSRKEQVCFTTVVYH